MSFTEILVIVLTILAYPIQKGWEYIFANIKGIRTGVRKFITSGFGLLFPIAIFIWASVSFNKSWELNTLLILNTINVLLQVFIIVKGTQIKKMEKALAGIITITIGNRNYELFQHKHKGQLARTVGVDDEAGKRWKFWVEKDEAGVYKPLLYDNYPAFIDEDIVELIPEINKHLPNGTLSN